MAYVFYDTETTGTETAFDQILQFAAIKTDDDFVEQDRFDIRCRLLPHIVPSPKALQVTRVTPAMLTDPALPSHFEMMRRIRAKLMEWSPATFMGYNSLAFDEELMRQAFFQNLLPAYLTNMNGNTRGDIMRVSHAVHTYSPENIAVPIGDNGRPTFRLDQLAPANGYNHDQAHEAMADVEATIFMARLARDRAPEVWNAMTRSVSKNAVKQFVRDQDALSFTEYFFSSPHSWLVAYCGENPNYDAQVAVFDLQHDPDEYRHLSVDELIDVLNGSPKVIRTLRANAQPILMPEEAAPESTQALEVAPDERQRRIQVIRGDSEFQSKVGIALTRRFEDQEPSAYLEKQIYDGFPSWDDQALMGQFHEGNWTDRADIAEQIEDARLSEFACRLIFFEEPSALPHEKQLEMKRWLAGRVMADDDNLPWTTIPMAKRDNDTLLSETTDADAELLSDVADFLEAAERRIVT